MAGVAGVAGEVGHMVIDPNGSRCGCGNYGCWETYINQAALYRRVRAAVEAGQPSSLVAATEGQWERLTVGCIVDAARLGDAVALAALDDTAHYLGLGLTNLINALNPQLVVLGGEMSRASEFLVPRVKTLVRERALPGSRDSVEIVAATHGSDGAAMGGIASIYRRMLSEPLAAAFRPGAAPPAGSASLSLASRLPA
jgi:predicted NBD/HSP70 family sugar kinase